MCDRLGLKVLPVGFRSVALWSRVRNFSDAGAQKDVECKMRPSASVVKAPNGDELLLPWAPGFPKVVRFVFLTKYGMLCFFNFARKFITRRAPGMGVPRIHV